MHVYMIRCTTSGKKYIGSCISDDHRSRIRRHISDLRAGVHVNLNMQRSWKLYGSESFTFEIVQTIDFDHAKSRKENEMVVRNLEDEWITKEGTLAPAGFNCKTAALCVPTEETRAKMSEAQRNRPPASCETRLKMSQIHKGRTYSDESKQKMREAQLGEKSFWYGKKRSDSTRAKMSASQKDRVISDEHRENLRKAVLNQLDIECPHCGKKGKPTPMKRWHFEKCSLLNL